MMWIVGCLASPVYPETCPATCYPAVNHHQLLCPQHADAASTEATGASKAPWRGLTGYRHGRSRTLFSLSHPLPQAPLPQRLAGAARAGRVADVRRVPRAAPTANFLYWGWRQHQSGRAASSRAGQRNARKKKETQDG